ncbi:MAG: YceI family protein [Chthoniobacterales bacterium]|nr:YceI family protein [Chthoniobacterales bacterium]
MRSKLFRRYNRPRQRFATFGTVALLLLAATAHGEARRYEVAGSKTLVQFQLRHLLGTVVGRFHEVKAVLEVDPNAPEHSSVSVTIPSRTVETDNRTRDKHLRTELFEVAKYPTITFRSRSVTRTGRDQADVLGDLTLHGVTKPLLLHVTSLGVSKNSAGVEISRWRATGGTFKRRDFGLVWSKGVEAISMIGDDITLKIEAEAVRSE